MLKPPLLRNLQQQLHSLSLFAKLSLLLGVGTVLMFWLIAASLEMLETRLSLLNPKDRQQMLAWRDQAEQLYVEGNEIGLKLFLQQLRQQEQSWAAVAHVKVESFDDTDLVAKFDEGFILGRSIDWKIHLYQDYNPVMDLMFQRADARLLLELPARMRPGAYWPPLKLLLQLLLPLMLLMLLIYALYQHLLRPVRQLQQAARALQQSDFSQDRPPASVRMALGERQDELADLAESYDRMAQRLSQLIIGQRNFIADFSHELRTPLTRLQLALDSLPTAASEPALHQRLQQESLLMRKLAENALTFAWLEHHPAVVPPEPGLCLTELLEVIADNAAFEYPDRQLVLKLPPQMLLAAGNSLLLGQALENIIRNALRYTPAAGVVTLEAHSLQDEQGCDGWQLSCVDQGPGVPPVYLSSLFQPFFRVPAGSGGQPVAQGFGLGLALAARQIRACGGHISASNITAAATGLQIRLWLPALAQM
ncbi:MAG: histidine kinase sensor domain-containing protein [Rheinheimera sp.]|nr:histidine kinase sensor domain-containing protein [Rheinheimera sp.]